VQDTTCAGESGEGNSNAKNLRFFLQTAGTDVGCATFSISESIKGNRHSALENSNSPESFFEHFAQPLVQERIENGHIDLES